MCLVLLVLALAVALLATTSLRSLKVVPAVRLLQRLLSQHRLLHLRPWLQRCHAPLLVLATSPFRCQRFVKQQVLTC
jgi:hypothetical protein